jgi:hypothetical protein
MELLKVTMFVMLMSEIIEKEACSLIQNPCKRFSFFLRKGVFERVKKSKKYIATTNKRII